MKSKAVLIIVLLLGFVSFANKINTERFKSILDIKNDYNVTADGGRLDIWETGLKLLLRNPVTGVGVNCFPFAIGYEREANREIPRWQVAHNSFIQIGVETGIIGFFVFISLIWACLKTFSRCRGMKHDEAFPDLPQFQNVGGLVQISFIGLLVCSFFLAQAYSPLFTLYFGLSAVMKSLYMAYDGSDQ